MPFFRGRHFENRLGEIPVNPGHIELLKQWAGLFAQGALDKETANYGVFKQSILEGVLGYAGKMKDGKAWTVDEARSLGDGEVEFALGRFSTTHDPVVLAPLEIKGATVRNLDAKLSGSQRSPVEQAWNYATAKTGVKWVLVTNYNEIRLYSRDLSKEEYEVFFLAELAGDPAAYKRFILLLSAENLLGGATQKLLEAAELEKREITEKLYGDYHELRAAIIRDLCADHQKDLAAAIRLAQLLLDRVIFVLFAADKGLLPPDIFKSLFNPGSPLNPQPLRDNFRNLFHAINNGSPPLGIYGYNGGLFTPDPELDALKLGDALCRAFKKLDEYDFNSDVSVNILGHIFEQSISDLEKLRGGGESMGRRKRFGVYYTPDHITAHIVRATLGKLCETKKEELKLHDVSLPLQAKKKKDARVEIEAREKILDAYREWLLGLAICDPACGSGAFLVAALDFLKKEHALIDRLRADLNNDPLVLSYYDAEILEKNLYGVDINAESVEITKLSLWLHSAKRERKLNTLIRNIKCGNSLVSDPAVAGEKAFDWQKEFPRIFEKGGFDAVIGNPPYGARFEHEEKAYFNTHYKLQNYQHESCLLFLEKSFAIVKQNGFSGFIIPNTWLLNLQTRKIREFIFTSVLLENIVHYKKPIFPEAVVDTEIMVYKNQKPTGQHNIKINIVGESNETFEKFISQNNWFDLRGAPVNIFDSEENQAVKEKAKKFPTLDKLCKITQGAKPFQAGKGIPKQTNDVVSEKPFVSETQKDESFRPLLRGSLMNRYQINWEQNYWIKFGDCLAEPRYSASYDEDEKIIVRQTGDRLNATLDVKKFVVRDNLYTLVPNKKNISLKYVLGLLNSDFLNWYYQNIVNYEKGEPLAQVKRGHLAQLPIATTEKQVETEIIKLVDEMLRLNAGLLATRRRFIKDLANNFNLAKTTAALEHFDEKDFPALLSELKKLKKSIPLPQQAEWENHFETAKTACQNFAEEIKNTDAKINEMVYALYGLTGEEIALVKKNAD